MHGLCEIESKLLDGTLKFIESTTLIPISRSGHLNQSRDAFSWGNCYAYFKYLQENQLVTYFWIHLKWSSHSLN